MIVLVIGGAGYIGSHTSRALQRAGHEVIVFDNLSTGYECLASGFELIRGDVLDTDVLSPAVRRADARPIHKLKAFFSNSTRCAFHGCMLSSNSFLREVSHA